MPAPTTPPAPPREPSFVDVEVLDFGPLYKEAVSHYLSLSPERASWSPEKRGRLVIRTECRWGRITVEDDAPGGAQLFLLNEKGEGPKGPLSATTRAYIALFAEMKPVADDPGFFEPTPFCKVPIDLATVKTLRALGLVKLEDFVLAKSREFEAIYAEWRSLILSARERVRSRRAERAASRG
jgi:hypothetical protein